MTLLEKQQLFAQLLVMLITRAIEMGFQVTLGDVYRDPRVPYGHPKSTHRYRLAADINLFRDGEYLTDTESHRPLGEWWEAQHELCRWGGRFKDGNHYSLTHLGVA